ncbi:esterase/lipase family protein [Vibrio sp.]|uniref:esterase/lipase family protein n=1 Tax=Vibrio sp. TaxID=678 RepID=UPI003D10EF90
MKIIILHGLYMHGVVMKPLSHRLRRFGYQTKVLTYNSVAINEQQLFHSLDRALSKHETNILVGHSLGGLVIKHYLASRRPDVNRVSHVIAIGSPLRGASIVSRIQQLGIGAILGNSTQFGLAEHDDSWQFEQKLGCIAGTMPIGARPLLLIDQPDQSDGTVTVAETKIDGMTDHILCQNTHTSLIYSEFVPHQIDYFIHHDHFYRP